MAGDGVGAQAALRAELAMGTQLVGRLYSLTGEGPADLLSLKAARVLSEADVLVESQGADPAIAILARRDSQRLSAADLSNPSLIDLIGQGLQVVLIGQEAIGLASKLEVEPLPAALP
jgi:precorrin-2 dehydrogenase/sirohydrochlorin ferrochelatase